MQVWFGEQMGLLVPSYAQVQLAIYLHSGMLQVCWNGQEDAKLNISVAGVGMSNDRAGEKG